MKSQSLDKAAQGQTDSVDKSRSAQAEQDAEGTATLLLEQEACSHVDIERLENGEVHDYMYEITGVCRLCGAAMEGWAWRGTDETDDTAWERVV